MRLRYGSVEVVLDDPDLPFSYSWKQKQTMVETEGGRRYVYNFGVKRRRWELKWNFLPLEQFLKLENFIVNVVNFKEVPFLFFDHNGVPYTVRCISFSHSQVSPRYYSVSLVLEEEV